MVERHLAIATLCALGIAAMWLLACFGQPTGAKSPFVATALAVATLDVAPRSHDDGSNAPLAGDPAESDSDTEDDDDDFGGRDELTMAAAVDLDAPGAPCVRTCLRPESSSVKSRTLEPETPPPRS